MIKKVFISSYLQITDPDYGRRFSSEVELGYFLATILDVLIPYAFGAVSGNPLTYEIHTSPSGIKVLNFQCSLDYTTRFLNEEFDLASSENHEVVKFIATKDNPIFLINKAAVELFEHLHNDLEKLQNKVYKILHVYAYFYTYMVNIHIVEPLNLPFKLDFFSSLKVNKS
ncbi:hypothetical protein Hanom_Chr06g00558811 [Helianthus anomalus]